MMLQKNLRTMSSQDDVLRQEPRDTVYVFGIDMATS